MSPDYWFTAPQRLITTWLRELQDAKATSSFPTAFPPHFFTSSLYQRLCSSLCPTIELPHTVINTFIGTDLHCPQIWQSFLFRMSVTDSNRGKFWDGGCKLANGGGEGDVPYSPCGRVSNKHCSMSSALQCSCLICWTCVWWTKSQKLGLVMCSTSLVVRYWNNILHTVPSTNDGLHSAALAKNCFYNSPVKVMLMIGSSALSTVLCQGRSTINVAHTQYFCRLFR